MSNNKKNPYWKDTKAEGENVYKGYSDEIDEAVNKEDYPDSQVNVVPNVVPEPESTDIPEKVRIVWDTVDVRYGDSEDYMAIGTVTKGREYPVVTISAETGWYALRIPGYILWVPPESVTPI